MKKILIFSALAAVASAHAQNLVVNGDFSLGNLDFSSDYNNDQTTGGQMGEGKYAIVTDANDVHTAWDHVHDHTTGTGNFMALNGSGLTNAVVWSQSIALLANTAYTFSYYGASVYSANPATLASSVNGVSIGTDTTLSTTTGDYSLVSSSFTSGAAGFYTFAIYDTNAVAAGNDFGIDDISVQAVPEPASMAALGLGALGLLRRRAKRA